jgi:pimeloyl-ACP methyl ester carboxylesterase
MIFRFHPFALVVALVAAASSTSFADGSVDTRATIAASQKIAPGGIDELKTVKIGGIEQWISVRGNSTSNPILLFIHGGPGSPMMPLAWTFQRPWEEFFTVVQWDQRGAGKTFASANQQPDTSLSIDRIQADAVELIVWLRKTYGADKIFVMAHSFGSIVGMGIAQQHPEWLHAYIGVGQVVNGRRNEEVSYRETLALAQTAGDTTAIRELKSILPYPAPGRSTPLASVFLERKWVTAYGGILFGKKTDDPSALCALSPLYTESDLLSIDPGAMMSVQMLLPELIDVNFDAMTAFKCPVFLFAGVDDRATPTSIVKEFYGRIRAPKKQLFIIDHAAHYVVTEAPGEVLLDLVRDVRPLAATPH